MWQTIYFEKKSNLNRPGGGGESRMEQAGCSSEILNLILKETIWAWLKLFVTP